MDTSRRDWVDVPEDVLGLIAQRFRTRIDLLRFRATCHTFRTSSPFPPPKPLFPVLTPLELRESTLYAIEPLHKIDNTDTTARTWVIRVEESESESEYKIRVIDPLSGFRFGNLPNKLPKKLNLLDYRVKEISKLYQLLGRTGFDGVGDVGVQKVVALTCIDGFVAVMALTDYGGRAYARRRGDNEWTRIDIGPEDPVAIDWTDCVDIVTHNGKFYAFGSTGRTITVDCKSLNVNEVAPAPPSDPTRYSARMVKSFDGLYVVDMYQDPFDEDNKFTYLHGYKLDEKMREWVRVTEEVEDIAFFMGVGCSFSLSNEEFPGCKGNCLYFVDDYNVDRDYPGSDVMICDFEERIVGLFSAYTSDSKIFWPPPTWLK